MSLLLLGAGPAVSGEVASRGPSLVVTEAVPDASGVSHIAKLIGTVSAVPASGFYLVFVYAGEEIAGQSSAQNSTDWSLNSDAIGPGNYVAVTTPIDGDGFPTGEPGPPFEFTIPDTPEIPTLDYFELADIEPAGAYWEVSCPQVTGGVSISFRAEADLENYPDNGFGEGTNWNDITDTPAAITNFSYLPDHVWAFARSAQGLRGLYSEYLTIEVAEPPEDPPEGYVAGEDLGGGIGRFTFVVTNEIEPDHVDWSYDGALVEVDSGANWIELDFNAAPTGSYPIYGQAFNSDGIGGEPQGIGVYWDGTEVGFE